MRLLSCSQTYNQIQELIQPYHFSVRVEADPLRLHKCGLPLIKFTEKYKLVSYLNIQIEALERKKNETHKGQYKNVAKKIHVGD